MSKFGVYLKLELKRMLGYMPRLLGGMMIFVLLIIGMAFVSSALQQDNNEKFDALNVAIVGSEDDEYTKLAINTVENMETVKMTFVFTYCGLEEAEAGLEENVYDMIFVFPDDYIDGFMHGENKTIEVRYGKGQSTVVGYIMKSLSNVAANLVIESEKNIYSMQDYYREKDLENEKEAVIDVNIAIIQKIFARAESFFIEEVNATDGLPLGMYYFCDAIILIFLFLGLQCSKLLQRNDVSLEKKMYVGGLSATKQVIAKFTALLVVFSIIFSLFICAAAIAFNIVGQAEFILQGQTVSEMILNMIKAGIILIPICTLIMFIYEIFNDTASGVLTLLLVILVLGFIAGCFYPLSFLPMTVQAVANLTVTRAMFCYVSGCINNDFSVMWLLIMLVHSFIFLAMNILVRKRKLSA